MTKLKGNNDKISVTYFQRRPHTGFSFSFEQIFNTVRAKLENRIDYKIFVCKKFNTGLFSKFINMIDAALHQSSCINHITGEVHFLNLLMHKKKVLLTIHDCRFMQRKIGIAKIFMRYLYLKWPVIKSRFVVSVSQSTKDEIIKYTGCNPDKISVVPVCIDKTFQPSPKTFNAIKPVLLQTGTAENKNLLKVAKALKGIECCLVIIGKLTKQQKAVLKEYNIDHKNYYNLTQAEMFEQYKACDFVIFVSTHEGFGMPIVEANCVERAVLTSNISSMPEVAGDAACFVNPFDVNEIRQGILKLIHDAAYREQLIENGRKNKIRFDAQHIADAYYRLYQKIADAC